MIKQEKGFTLVELIVTIVLVGIIGVFTTLFVYTGLNGYLRAKDTSEGALKAQIALDRISLELRDISEIKNYDENVEIEYTSTTLPGNRKIKFNSNAIIIDVDDIANELLDGVDSFVLRATADRDLNFYSDGNNEIEAIDINFTVERIGRDFKATIFPRNMLSMPSG